LEIEALKLRNCKKIVVVRMLVGRAAAVHARPRQRRTSNGHMREIEIEREVIREKGTME
jgi:hypothetical protein